MVAVTAGGSSSSNCWRLYSSPLSFPFSGFFALYTSQKASMYPDWIPLLLRCANYGMLQTCEKGKVVLSGGGSVLLCLKTLIPVKKIHKTANEASGI
jgi:hypothetical protein